MMGTATSMSFANFGTPMSSALRALPSRAALLVAYTVKESEEAITVDEMIKFMRDNGLPISAIAEIAKVERKTIYSWLDGARVQGARAERVKTLFRLLSRIYKNDLRSLYRTWNTKLQCGFTIKELMSVDTLSEPQITESLNELAQTIRRYSDREQRRPASQTSRISVIDEMPVAVLDR